MLAIMCAMKGEADGILNRMENPITQRVAKAMYYYGKLNGSPVVVAITHPGKVNAAASATWLCCDCRIKGILNLGVAGALTYELRQGHVVLPLNVVQSDIDTTAVGDPPGLVSGLNVQKFPMSEEFRCVSSAILGKKQHQTRIAYLCTTSDKFVSSPDEKMELHEKWIASICDMEAGAIAQVCHMFDMPFMTAKVVSDSLSGGSKEYKEFMKEAPEIIADIAALAVENGW